MRGGFKLFLISAAALAVVVGLERWLVPCIVPVAFADEPQPIWAVETAFVLRALELLTAAVAAISLTFSFAAWTRRQLFEEKSGRAR